MTCCDVGEEAVDSFVRLIERNSTIQTILLRDNKLCGESGEKLCSAIMKNRTLTKVNLEKNSIKQKHFKEIACVLDRNKNLHKNAQIPKIKQHLTDMRKERLYDDL